MKKALLVIDMQEVTVVHAHADFLKYEFCEFLKKNVIDTVELVGVDGGGCVSLTAQGACKNGYNVIMNAPCSIQRKINTLKSSKSSWQHSYDHLP
ncbi:isochorismatase family protein [Ruminococcus sp.]|uniref:isochorismatase family protein n=1 Tax=Ruminococcus sp. TaxID=41978 RepID=UPI0025DDD8AB|nr:isochorismatase family protein [Ruminococcus sp.]MBQ8965187.1 isochorismatase family protein [Ruminococcus sp.]